MKAQRLFSGGQYVSTPGAIAKAESLGINFTDLLDRHFSGDWGDISDNDKAVNDAAVKNGGQILSAYGGGDDKIWIITEWDRSVTTIMLPEEY